MEELISVIVPVLDVESYLTSTIDSLEKQTYSNIEIILICRESNKNCMKLCNYYAEKDKRLKVVPVKMTSTKNFKNLGLSKAKGKYITFVDGGDTVSKSYVEYMYNLLKDEKADIVCTRRYIKGSKQKKSIDYDTYTNKDIMYKYLTGHFRSHFYAKLYKKELFDEIEYPEVSYYDDFMVGYKIFDKAKKLVNSHNELYSYNEEKRDRFFGIQDYDQMKKIGACFDMLTYVEEKYPDYIDDCKAKICLEALDLFKYVRDKEYRKQLFSYISLYRRYALSSENITFKEKLICVRSILGYNFLKLSLGMEKFIKKPIK